MKFTVGNYKIVKKQALTQTVFSFTLLCPDVAKAAKPGQFVHIQAPGFLLRRPISICEIDAAAQTLRIVFEVRGDGTQVLANFNEGDYMDMIAPLGNGFTILDPSKKIIVIGGGIGVPPMLETAKSYGDNATAIIGFRNRDAVILKEDFAAQKNHVIVCTDDGSEGVHGFVTEPLEQLLQQGGYQQIYACGPSGMLKGIAALAKQYQIPCEVSLEERMACGVGACLGCACKIMRNGVEYMLHVCKDGPVFDAQEVIL